MTSVSGLWVDAGNAQERGRERKRKKGLDMPWNECHIPVNKTAQLPETLQRNKLVSTNVGYIVPGT